MVYTDIRAAFETALYNLAPTFPTAWENVVFTKNDQEAHQECKLVFNTPSNPTFPAGFRREQGEFQVFLNYKSGTGTAEIYNKAEGIANLFRRGSSFTSGSAVVNVFESPRVGDAFLAGDRYILAVRVPFSVDVYEN